MIKAAVIEDGIVKNIILVDSIDFMPGLVVGDTANIGDIWDGETFTKPHHADTTKQVTNAFIKAEIFAIEEKQGRAVRDAILTGDKTRLAQYNDQIAALRAQLLP